MNAYTTIVMIFFTVPLNFIFLKKDYFIAANKRKFVLFILAVLSGFTTLTARIPLMYIPYGTATTIYYIRPTLVMFAAYFLIHEKLGWTRISLAILTLIGVIVVVEPPFIFTYKAGKSEGPAWAYAIAFAQPVINTFLAIVMRITKDVHFVISTTVCSVFTVLISMCFLPLADKIELPGKWILWLAIVGVGCFTAFAGLLIVLAFHFSDAGVLSTVLSVEIVFSFLSQIIIFNQIPSYVSSIGACIVVLSVSGMGLSEYLASRKKKKVIAAEDVQVPSIEELPIEVMTED